MYFHLADNNCIKNSILWHHSRQNKLLPVYVYQEPFKFDESFISRQEWQGV